MLPITETQEEIEEYNRRLVPVEVPLLKPLVIRGRRRQTRMPNTKEIEAAIRARIEQLDPALALYANATEPQHVEIRNYTSGQVGALRDVLNMILYRRRSLV